MSNDNKTLADVQPGGMVRLGDQAERGWFEEWLATQHDQGYEHVMATVSDTDDRYQSPVTSSMWSAWQAANAAREGGRINGWRVIDGVRVYSAYAHASILDDQQYVRYEDYLAALSAQPSPGGQGDALAALPLYRLADDANGNRGLHRDDTGSWVKLQDVERALAASQLVGEPVAWVSPEQLEAHADPLRGEGGHYLPTRKTAAGKFTQPLYAAPPAQVVDLEQFREAVAEWRSNWASYGRTMTSAGRDTSKARRNVDEADRLLALIDSKAVGNG